MLRSFNLCTEAHSKRARGCGAGLRLVSIHLAGAQGSPSLGGNWTALFCTGSEFKPVPAPLRSDNIYIFQGTFGYDGQEYHYIAHDPFLTRGFSALQPVLLTALNPRWPRGCGSG